MNIPINLCFPRKVRISLRCETGGNIRRDDAINEFIDAEGGKDFVGVEREGSESESIGNGLSCSHKECGGRERIPHCGKEQKEGFYGQSSGCLKYNEGNNALDKEVAPNVVVMIYWESKEFE